MEINNDSVWKGLTDVGEEFNTAWMKAEVQSVHNKYVLHFLHTHTHTHTQGPTYTSANIVASTLGE